MSDYIDKNGVTGSARLAPQADSSITLLTIRLRLRGISIFFKQSRKPDPESRDKIVETLTVVSSSMVCSRPRVHCLSCLAALDARPPLTEKDNFA
jgi:hypothetical protein